MSDALIKAKELAVKLGYYLGIHRPSSFPGKIIIAPIRVSYYDLLEGKAEGLIADSPPEALGILRGIDYLNKSIKHCEAAAFNAGRQRERDVNNEPVERS